MEINEATALGVSLAVPLSEIADVKVTSAVLASLAVALSVWFTSQVMLLLSVAVPLSVIVATKLAAAVEASAAVAASVRVLTKAAAAVLASLAVPLSLALHGYVGKP